MNGDRSAPHRREQALHALHLTLTTQVEQLRDSQHWQQWLAVAARFGQYSLHNQLLIAAQRPGAVRVAGFAAWTELQRQVNRGEKGIALLAPLPRRTPPPAPAGPLPPKPSGGVGRPDHLADHDQQAHDLPRRSPLVSGFRIVHVFDISQTHGPELPTPQLLVANGPVGLWDALTAVLGERGFSVDRAGCAPANGLTDFRRRRVTISPDLPAAQAVKTLAHELGHVLLHDPATPGPTSPATGAGRLPAVAGATCRGVAEVEAESVAYLVMASHGLDSARFTVPYLAGWAGEAPTAALLRSTADRVLGAARVALRSVQSQPEQRPAVLAAAIPRDNLVTTMAPPTPQSAGPAGTHQPAPTAVAAMAQPAPPPVDPEPATAPSTGHRAAGAAHPPAPHHQAPHHRVPMTPDSSVQHDRLLTLHARSVAFYRRQLGAETPAATRVVGLLRDRGVAPASQRAAQLGYAPAGWTALVDHLRAGGASDAELLAAGLAMSSASGALIDRFRDRLIFPVQVDHGQTIALLGRAVGLDVPGRSGPRAPKYLNSPGTDLYQKGQVLYGLALGRPALAAGAIPVLVEGPMDVLAVHAAAGARSRPAFAALAPGGTALTGGQVALLDAAVGGLAERGVIVAFDADQAGRAAAGRAYALLRQAAVWPHALVLPADQDPASLVQREGASALRLALETAGQVPLLELVVQETIAGYGDQLRWAEGRLAAARKVAKLLLEVPADHIARQVGQLAHRLDLPVTTVHALLVEALEQRPPGPGPGRPPTHQGGPTASTTVLVPAVPAERGATPAAGPPPGTGTAQLVRASFPVTLPRSTPAVLTPASPAPRLAPPGREPQGYRPVDAGRSWPVVPRAGRAHP